MLELEDAILKATTKITYVTSDSKSARRRKRFAFTSETCSEFITHSKKVRDLERLEIRNSNECFYHQVASTIYGMIPTSSSWNNSATTASELVTLLETYIYVVVYPACTTEEMATLTDMQGSSSK